MPEAWSSAPVAERHEDLRQIADGIPGARFAVLPDAAHLLNVERPAEVNRALLDHLRRAPHRP